MSLQRPASSPSHRPGWLDASAVYLFYVAVVLRTIANAAIRPRLPIYLALELLYLMLLSLMLWRPAWKPAPRWLYFLLQALVVFALQALRLRFDFLILLYVPLCYQAALLLRSPARWVWVGIYLLLSCIPLMVAMGTLQGLAVALIPMTASLIFPGYVVVNQDLEAASQASQDMLAKLQDTNRQLQSYAGQVDQLSALQVRSRLARELHDSVSQTLFSITLFTRAAQILLERDPRNLRPRLEQLQVLTRSALEELRGLIASLRLQESQSDRRPQS
jgi:signal transduction histidine kinase